MEILVGAAWSILTGVALWLLLPRGVVLTKQHPVVSPYTGKVEPDTWKVVNPSSLPVRIVKIVVAGVFTIDVDWEPTRWQRIWAVVRRRPAIQWHDQPVAGNDHGLSIEFDDEVLGTRRQEWNRAWRGQIVPPGETLTAVLLNNTTVRIVYRRAGWSGVFERRELVFHGYA